MTPQFDLLKMFDGVRCCFWFGLPPCPRCGSDHGDPKATADYDDFARACIRSTVATLRADLAGAIQRLAAKRSEDAP